MQNLSRFRNTLALTAFLTLAAGAAGAQTIGPSGQAAPPGTQVKGSGSNAGCTMDNNGNPTNTADPGCAGLAPGFYNPSLNMPHKLSPKDMTSTVTVNKTLTKPSDPLPMGEEMSFDGDSTVIKAKGVRLGACFSSGKRWSRDSGAPTSTTCADKKGNVVAMQDCKPADGDTPMSCSVVWPRQEEAKK